MLSEKVKIKNKYGIHARPSSMISELTNKFKSSITFEYNEKEADASSIMNLILLCIEPGVDIIVKTEGEDEEDAMKAILHLLTIVLPSEEFE